MRDDRSEEARHGALSGADIRKLLESKDPQSRLVVAPLLEPAEQLRDDQASVDVRLGFRFSLVSAWAYGAIDEFASETENLTDAGLSNLFREYYVPFGNSIVIHPHQLILAATLEYLRLPPNVMAYVIGRSTWGRLGLVVATAVGVHPLYAGTLTLELRNLGETPLKLYPGQTIAQLFFHWVELYEADDVTSGRYSGGTELQPQAPSSSTSKSVLRKLMEKQRAARS